MEYFDTDNPKIGNRIIIENELAFAFPSNKPIVPGHVLVCPKRQASKIDDLTDEEMRAILHLQKQLKPALIKAFDADGFNYAWNEGKDAGQTVNHFHLHMLPRKKGDTGVFEYDPRKFLYRKGERDASTEDELSEVAKLVKENI